MKILDTDRRPARAPGTVRRDGLLTIETLPVPVVDDAGVPRVMLLRIRSRRGQLDTLAIGTAHSREIALPPWRTT